VSLLTIHFPAVLIEVTAAAAVSFASGLLFLICFDGVVAGFIF